MRTKREDAPAKVRNFYKNAKSLIDMSNGEIKPGMLPMVLRMVGGISRAKEEDIEAVNDYPCEQYGACPNDDDFQEKVIEYWKGKNQ